MHGSMGEEQEMTMTFFDTSAMLISFILLGKYFEIVAKGKTSDAIRKLMSLQVFLLFHLVPFPYPLFLHTSSTTFTHSVLFQATKAVLVSDNNEETEIDIDLVQRGDVLKVNFLVSPVFFALYPALYSSYLFFC